MDLVSAKQVGAKPIVSAKLLISNKAMYVRFAAAFMRVRLAGATTL